MQVYSFKVALYKYNEGLVSTDVLLSGFEYSTTGTPQPRFVIHTGRTLRLLWTGGQFSYTAAFDSVILTLRTKPADGTNEYYLVNFSNAVDQRLWTNNHSKSFNKSVGMHPDAVYQYFLEFMKANYYG